MHIKGHCERTKAEFSTKLKSVGSPCLFKCNMQCLIKLIHTQFTDLDLWAEQIGCRNHNENSAKQTDTRAPYNDARQHFPPLYWCGPLRVDGGFVGLLLPPSNAIFGNYWLHWHACTPLPFVSYNNSGIDRLRNIVATYIFWQQGVAC